VKTTLGREQSAYEDQAIDDPLRIIDRHHPREQAPRKPERACAGRAARAR
jgi:hypothetical protein